MKLYYNDSRVEKYFSDFSKLQRKLPFDWVRIIKKHVNHLEAAECFGDFLRLGLGKPERVINSAGILYSLHISANVRLIVIIQTEQENIQKCSEIIIKGVCDYHGDKENWYIP